MNVLPFANRKRRGNGECFGVRRICAFEYVGTGLKWKLPLEISPELSHAYTAVYRQILCVQEK